MAALERHWTRLSVVSWLLLPLSWVFCLLVMLRRRLFSLGVRKVQRLPVPVIVVGNLTVGGTGKTPLVLWLADELRAAGFRPGILTRGYRGQSRHWPLAVVPGTSADEAGDEAVLLAERSGCPVIAGPDRVADARELVARGCNVLVSDDGLQHYRLARDVEIAVIDGTRRFGNGRCLPAGPLREPVSRLQSVHFVVANGEPARGEMAMQIDLDGFRPLAGGGQTVTAEAFPGPVHAVAGIGNPERFFTLLRNLGLTVVPHRFPDHHRFRPADLEFGDHRPVILTEKDAVKCRAFARPQHWVCAVSARPETRLGKELLQRLKERDFGQETA